jgi:hypothetical protein
MHVARLDESAKAHVLIKSEFSHANALLSKIEQDFAKRDGRTYPWNDLDGNHYLKAAYDVVARFWRLGEADRTAYPKTQAINMARVPNDILYAAKKLFKNNKGSLKVRFQKFWNTAFVKNFASQRTDGKGTHNKRKAWRTEWALRLPDIRNKFAPGFYFDGWGEPPIKGKDQPQWKLSKIWGSRAILKEATGYQK